MTFYRAFLPRMGTSFIIMSFMPKMTRSPFKQRRKSSMHVPKRAPDWKFGVVRAMSQV
jgi:hypothetical protein